VVDRPDEHVERGVDGHGQVVAIGGEAGGQLGPPGSQDAPPQGRPQLGIARRLDHQGGQHLLGPGIGQRVAQLAAVGAQVAPQARSSPPQARSSPP
jgi:hypothetical protein